MSASPISAAPSLTPFQASIQHASTLLERSATTIAKAPTDLAAWKQAHADASTAAQLISTAEGRMYPEVLTASRDAASALVSLTFGAIATTAGAAPTLRVPDDARIREVAAGATAAAAQLNDEVPNLYE